MLDERGHRLRQVEQLLGEKLAAHGRPKVVVVPQRLEERLACRFVHPVPP